MANEFQLQAANSISVNLLEKLTQAKKLIAMSAEFYGDFGPDNTSALDNYLKDFYSSFDEFTSVHYDDLEGRIVAFYPPSADDRNQRGSSHEERLHWKNMRANTTARISEIFRSKGENKRLMANVTCGAYNAQGNLIGFAISSIDLERLVQKFSSFKMPNGYSLVVIDNKGMPVFTTRPALSDINELVGAETIDKIRKSPDGYWTNIAASGEDKYTVFQYIPSLGWSVGVMRDHIVLNHVTHSYWWLVVMAALALLLSYAIARIMDRPIQESLKQLSMQIAEKRSEVPSLLRVRFPSELHGLQTQLTEAFGDLPAKKSEETVPRDQYRSVLDKLVEQKNITRNLMISLGKENIGAIIVNDFGLIIEFNYHSESLSGCTFKVGESIQEIFKGKFSEGHRPKLVDGKVSRCQFKKTGQWITFEARSLLNMNPPVYLLILKEALPPEDPDTAASGQKPAEG
jgi:hypothetical protein